MEMINIVGEGIIFLTFASICAVLISSWYSIKTGAIISFDNTKICGILSNALENAIHACEKMLDYNKKHCCLFYCSLDDNIFIMKAVILRKKHFTNQHTGYDGLESVPDKIK